MLAPAFSLIMPFTRVMGHTTDLMAAVVQGRARLSSISLLALVPFQPSAVTAINASIAQVSLNVQRCKLRGT